MEKFINLFITLVLVTIGTIAAILGFDYLTEARSFEQTIVIINLLVLVAILLGSSLYFTITKFRNADV
jgi:multisubunit Na+/H+ antiporter MnhB subunit